MNMVTGSELLDLMPQQKPFRYVDRVCEIGDRRIVTEYTFHESEWFYKGHFPDYPLTPGVILLEAMAQSGLVLPWIYLLAQDAALDDLKRYRAVFTDSNVEWFAPVRPGDTVCVTSHVLAWRMKRIRARAEMRKSTGELVATATLAGKGALWTSESLSLV